MGMGNMSMGNMGNMGMGMPMNMMGGMGMPMNMMGGMPMQNMNNMNMVENNEDDWMEGFKMGVEEVNNPTGNADPDLKTPGPKINVIFHTTQGTKRTIVLSVNLTIDQALKKYLDSVGKPELVNSDKISFLFNAAKLKFGDTTTVGNYFRNINNPKIVVNDTANLIGA